MNIFKRFVFTICILLPLVNARAELTNVNFNGVHLTYSSVSNVTWIADPNLLSTLVANDPTLIQTLVDNNLNKTYGTANNATSTTIEVADFGTGADSGKVTWEAAMAFVDYLNSTSYAGLSTWRLPFISDYDGGCDFSSDGSTTCGYNVATNGTVEGDEYAELYYGELNENVGLYPNGVIPQGDFWTSSENFDNAGDFKMNSSSGNNGLQNSSLKTSLGYAWVITTGQVAAVPEPEMSVLFLVGLLGVFLKVRRNNA